MKKILTNGIKFLLFFGIGAFIFWLIYRDQDPGKIMEILRNDVDYTWVWVSLGLGVLSHLSRTLRWMSMIEPLGHKPGIINTFLAVMIGYLMNLALPRMGEISRCGLLARYEKVSFTKLLGTVVAERIVDMIMLLLLTCIVIITQFGHLLEFLHKNPEIHEKLKTIWFSPYLLGGIFILIILVFFIRKMLKGSLISRKIGQTVRNFKEGLITIRNIKRKGTFVFHSVFIWFMYYLMLYVLFFSFDFTKMLSPIAALTTFVLASYGMVAPVQGGIGAWHFMAKEALGLYNVPNENGVIFALVAHSITTFMLIVMGLIAWFILPFVNRSKE